MSNRTKRKDAWRKKLLAGVKPVLRARAAVKATNAGFPGIKFHAGDAVDFEEATMSMRITRHGKFIRRYRVPMQFLEGQHHD